MARESWESAMDSATSLLEKFNGKETPCRGAEGSGFFPFPSTTAELEQSEQICRGCPFRRECLSHAVVHEETGVWGGYYLCDGRVKKGHSPFLGKRSVRTQTEDEMFEEIFVRIPLEKLDAFNAGTWNPPAEWYDDDEWDRENGLSDDDDDGSCSEYDDMDDETLMRAV